MSLLLLFASSSGGGPPPPVNPARLVSAPSQRFGSNTFARLIAASPPAKRGILALAALMVMGCSEPVAPSKPVYRCGPLDTLQNLLPDSLQKAGHIVVTVQVCIIARQIAARPPSKRQGS